MVKFLKCFHVHHLGMGIEELDKMTNYFKDHGIVYDGIGRDNKSGIHDLYYNLTDNVDLSAILSYQYSDRCISLVFV